MHFSISTLSSDRVCDIPDVTLVTASQVRVRQVPIFGGVQSPVKGSEDRQIPKKRVATIKALPESSKQILCVPGKHHVVFLFPVVSSYRFSQRLFSHITPQVEA